MKLIDSVHDNNLPNNYDQAKQWISGLANSMAGVTTVENIYEIVLSDDSSSIDFSFRTVRENCKADLVSIKSVAKNNRNWDGIVEFMDAWTSEGLPFYQSIKELWFEFDHLKSDMPSVFIDAEDVFGDSEYEWVYAAAEIILGKELPIGLMEHVERCIAALPTGVGLYQVGMMLGREDKDISLRLFTAEMDISQMQQFLMDCASPKYEEIYGLMQELQPFTDKRYIVDFDVSENGLSQKHGLNFGLNYSQENIIDKFCTWLLERGQCSPQKHEAVVKWCRGSAHNISHFKLPLQSSAANAKVYLRKDLLTAKKMQNLQKW